MPGFYPGPPVCRSTDPYGEAEDKLTRLRPQDVYERVEVVDALEELLPDLRGMFDDPERSWDALDPEERVEWQGLTAALRVLGYRYLSESKVEGLDAAA